MEYRKILNFLDNTPNQPPKFRNESWVEIDDKPYVTCSPRSQIKFKTLMIRSRLCDYSDAYILFKGTITVENTGAAAVLNNRNKKVIFKNCALFTDCISETNNIEIDHSKNIGVVMPMHNLKEYSNNYTKISGSL